MPVDVKSATDRLMRFLAVEGVTGKEAAIGRELAAALQESGVPDGAIRLDDANTRRLAEGYFRVCVNLNDRARAFCMFVDTKKNTVVHDPDVRPNQVEFGGGF